MVMRLGDPLTALLAVQNAMDKARLSDWFGSRTSGRGVFPPVNVLRQGDDFIILAELPGVKKEDLEVTVKSDEVRITGKKAIEYEEGSSVHRRERTSGQFDRTLNIPAQVDTGGIRAELNDGILALHLPMAESERARSISIG